MEVDGWRSLFVLLGRLVLLHLLRAGLCRGRLLDVHLVGGESRELRLMKRMGSRYWCPRMTGSLCGSGSWGHVPANVRTGSERSMLWLCWQGLPWQNSSWREDRWLNWRLSSVRCRLRLAYQSGLSSKVRRELSLSLCLRLSLSLGLGSLNLDSVLLDPFGTDVGQIASAHSSEDDGNQVRRDAALYRLAEDGLFDLALLELQAFLPCLLLLLLSAVFLGLCCQPILHAVF
jgi:hypothetical protein